MHANPVSPEEREHSQSWRTCTTRAVYVFPMRDSISEGSSDDESCGDFARSREPSDGLA